MWETKLEILQFSHFTAAHKTSNQQGGNRMRRGINVFRWEIEYVHGAQSIWMNVIENVFKESENDCEFLILIESNVRFHRLYHMKLCSFNELWLSAWRNRLTVRSMKIMLCNRGLAAQLNGKVLAELELFHAADSQACWFNFDGFQTPIWKWLHARKYGFCEWRECCANFITSNYTKVSWLFHGDSRMSSELLTSFFAFFCCRAQEETLLT